MKKENFKKSDIGNRLIILPLRDLCFLFVSVFEFLYCSIITVKALRSTPTILGSSHLYNCPALDPPHLCNFFHTSH